MAKVSPARPQPVSGLLAPGEGVGHRVEIGADEQAVEPVVVAGVDDHRDLVRIDDIEQAAQEAGGSHATGERHDHAVKVVERSGRPPLVTGVTMGRAVPWHP